MKQKNTTASSATVQTAKAPKKTMTIRARNILAGYAFMTPWLIGFFVFIAYPIIYSVVLSLNAIRITPEGTEYTWRAFYFYDMALNKSTEFRTALASQVSMICYMTPIILVFSLIIALLLNGKFKMRAFFRITFFMPVIIMSGPAISQLLTGYTVDFSSSVPLIYDFLSSLPSFLATPAEYVLNNLVLILWFCGVQILIFLAGLQKISPDLYEAASIDGCGPVRTYFNVVLPMLKPTLISVGILELMWVWNDYLLPYLVLDITKYRTIPIHVQYLKGSYGTVDLGATMAVIMMAILPIIIVYLFCQKYIIKGVAAGAVKG